MARTWKRPELFRQSVVASAVQPVADAVVVAVASFEGGESPYVFWANTRKVYVVCGWRLPIRADVALAFALATVENDPASVLTSIRNPVWSVEPSSQDKSAS
jgi:hypothetical protein